MSSAKKTATGLAIMCICLMGCEGKVSVDMATTAPADNAIAAVNVDLQGIEFQKSDGGTERLEFNDPVRIDLTDYQTGDLFRLFTDEEIPDGDYSGVRLIFDTEDQDDDRVVLGTNEDFELAVTSSTAFSDVDFTVDKDDSSNDRIVLTLDLRQSLAFNDTDNRFTLTPVMQAVRAEDAGQLSGAVSANCSPGGNLAQGGAVYVFIGGDVVPDDRDAATPEPYLTTRVESDSNNAAPTYSFPFLPEGDYTLALTCQGDDEDGAADDELSFQNAVNESVEAERRTARDFP